MNNQTLIKSLRFKEISKGMSIHLCCVAYVVAGVAAYAAGTLCSGLSPLVVAAVSVIASAAAVFLFSVLFDNSSIFDPYWSIAPLGILLYWLLASNAVFDLRRNLVLLLILFWSIRLTWNWLVRWRGLGHEDWRYFRFRRFRLYWFISLACFHIFPAFAVLCGCLSLIPVLFFPADAFGILDIIALCITLCALFLENKADRELRIFKRGDGGTSKELLQTGIWAWTRHPNYLGEVLFWWGLALFGLSANHSYWWTLAGAAAITLLFLFISIPMMEKHLSKSYVKYENYAKSVPRFLPVKAVKALFTKR